MASFDQIIGNPAGEDLHQFGHQRYRAQIDFSGIPYEKVMKQIEVIGTEIIPAVKKYTSTTEAVA